MAAAGEARNGGGKLMGKYEVAARTRGEIEAQRRMSETPEGQLRIEALRAERSWWYEQVEKLLDMASDRKAALRLYNDRFTGGEPLTNAGDWALFDGMMPDYRRKIRMLKASLVAADLVSKEQADTIGTEPPKHEGLEKMRKENYEQEQKLRAGMKAILGHVSDEQKARNLYNRIDSPLTEEKLSSWVTSCVSEKLLGPEWLFGRKVGAIVSKMLRPGNAWSDKLLRVEIEDK